jgi:hypothetical protein
VFQLSHILVLLLWCQTMPGIPQVVVLKVCLDEFILLHTMHCFSHG